uniref:NADH-ubiquinone oxidoreductase chain 6 n=1 Tax=Cryptocephalus cynarae TaxID=1091364 RepID=A0A3G1GQB3_9CUCU|nr:NADH dehydrogenase subunit 6 [Cryptocephalus cynarae]
MMIILLIMILSTMCCLMNHPLTLGLILLLQTLMIALLTGLMSLNFWPSYIIFLIMIGGMLILFMYMTSVASNEKFKFSYKLSIYITSSTIMTIILSFSMDKHLMAQKFKMIETFNSQEYIYPQLFMNKFINFPHNLIYLMMIIYLLITLIAIVKISNKTKSTMRMKF